MAKMPESRDQPTNLFSEKASILLVDDVRANLVALRAILDGLGHDLVEARSGEEALELVWTRDFAVILLDLLMPGFNGFETAKKIRADARTRTTPIMFLTANDVDRAQIEQGFLLGAVDFFIKPLSPVIVRAKVSGLVALFQEKQRAKQESEQLRLLVQGTTEYAIFMLDPEGRVISWNTGAERLNGYRADEIIGWHFSKFYPQEAVDRRWPEHELTVARAEGRFEDEDWRVRKDGTPYWANVIITALRNETGRLLGFSKITRDMTERKKAEENARRLLEETTARRVAEENAYHIAEQRERLRVTLASIGDAVVSTDGEGRIDFINPVAQHLLGWQPDEAAGQPLANVFRIVNEQTRRPVDNPALRALREGVTVGLANHTVLIAKDGAERPIDDSAAPILDANGKVVGSVLVFRDITERRRNEARLREQQEWLRVTLRSIGDAVIATDRSGRVTFLNAVAQELTGWTEQEAIGQSLHNVFVIVNQQTRQTTEDPVAKVLRDGQIVGLANHTVLIARDGSERPIDDSAAPIRDSVGELIGVVLTFRDVTEQRRAEQHRSVRLAATHLLAEATGVDDGAAGVLRAVCENLAWDVGFFWTVDADKNALICRQSWHKPDVVVERFNAASCNGTFEKGRGLPGRVWASGEPAWILDIQQDSNFPRLASAVAHGMHSAVACPVTVGAQTLGVIEFFTQRIREADEDLLEMMATVAGGLGQFVERKSAEESLRRNEQELSDFFENATIGLHWLDPDGIILRANRAEFEMLGYTREEYVGRPIADFHVDKKVICDILNRLKKGERLEEYSARMRCKDGSIKHVRIDSSALWRDGRFVLTRSFTRDVTERKLAEERERILSEQTLAATAKFEAVFNQAGIFAAIVDLEGKLREVNDLAVNWCGYTRDQVVNVPFWKTPWWRGSEDVQARIRASIEQARSGTVYRDVLPYWLADGTERIAEYAMHPIRDETGAVRYLHPTGIDTFDRKKAEDALRESERRLASELAATSRLHALSSRLLSAGDLVSSLHDVLENAIETCQADFGNIQLLNASREALEIVAQRGFDQEFLDHFREVRVDDGSAYAQAALSGRRIVIEDVERDARFEPHREIAAKSGFRAVQSTPLRTHEGRVLGMLSTHWREPHQPSERDLRLLDLYARHAADLIERLRLEQALKDADRRKDEFLAMLAHELRNPLAPIRNGLEVLRLAQLDNDVVADARAMMERQLRQMVRLVDDLLDVSRITRNKLELRKERVELATVIQSAIETSRPLIEKGGHTLTVTLPPAAIWVDADPVRLAQVFANLLNNSAKYTEPGGKIDLIAEVHGESVFIRVRDTGLGIPAEAMPQLFEMFSQVDRHLERAHGGLGIGLTLVRRLVEMHGGSVEARSEGPGQGSEFTVRLPMSADRGAPSPDAAPGFGASRPHRWRVLVVDDNRDSAASLGLMLELMGHEIRTAHDGPAAVEAAETFRPNIILLDIGLPRMSGYDVCRRLREQPWSANTVIVALTGWGQIDDQRRSREAGFDHHLVKPVDITVLNRILAEPKRCCR